MNKMTQRGFLVHICTRVNWRCSTYTELEKFGSMRKKKYKHNNVFHVIRLKPWPPQMTLGPSSRRSRAYLRLTRGDLGDSCLNKSNSTYRLNGTLRNYPIYYFRFQSIFMGKGRSMEMGGMEVRCMMSTMVVSLLRGRGDEIQKLMNQIRINK
jgi:hypothetical protein